VAFDYAMVRVMPGAIGALVWSFVMKRIDHEDSMKKTSAFHSKQRRARLLDSGSPHGGSPETIGTEQRVALRADVCFMF
jgi:hypothetical protein